MSESNACIDPTAITDEEVLAYALGEGAAPTIGHLESCPSCQAKAGLYGDTAAAIMLGNHPPSIKIGELIQGLLSPQEALLLSAHLRTCASCEGERAGFAQFLAPELAPSGIGGLVRGLRRLLAQPMQPSPGAATALRGGSRSDSRAYTADGALIYLNIDQEAPGRGRKVITGRIESRAGDNSEAVASLFEGSQVLVTERVDEDGYFYFAAVKAGSYRIEVTTTELEIVIEPLVVA